MKPMVVLFAVMAVACGSLVPLAQPPHYPALVLDPHGRPLDTAEVINARALHLQAKALEGHHDALVAPLAHSVYAAPLAHAVAPAIVAAPVVVAAPVAVSHQSRVDVRTSPAVVTSHVAPVLGHSLVASPLLGLGHGHYLKKRSLGLLAHSVPLVAVAPAVSHQSRVDVISSPAVVSHAVAAPVLAHAAPVLAHAAPVVKYVGGSAVSHQSRVDVQSSPAVVSHSVVAPVVSHSVVAAPLSHGLGYAAPLSQGLGYAAPLAHGLDYAAPLAQGLGYAAPLAHGEGYAAPYAHSGLLHSSPLAHAW